MAQYRLLSLEELEALEKEFVEYLIINGITAEEWVRLKEEEKEKAKTIIDLFSDVVFEGVMRKVQYLEHRQRHQVRVFHCLADKMVMVGMRAAPGSQVDFTNADYLSKAAVNPPTNIEVFSTEKAYQQKREIELFELTQSGCTVSDGRLYKQLCLSLPGLS